MNNEEALRAEIMRLRGVVRIQGTALEELEQLALKCVADLVPVSSYKVRDIARRGMDHGRFE